MIICSCNVISQREIEAAVEELVGSDPDVVLTPGMVYRAIGCRPKCGTCLKTVVDLIHAHRESLQKGRDPAAGGRSDAASSLE